LLPCAVVLTEVTLLGVHFAQHPGSDIGFLLDSLSTMTGCRDRAARGRRPGRRVGGRLPVA
jgi:hypothetical protein